MSITLRKIEPEDLPYLYLWENDKSVWQYGDVHNPISKFDLKQYIESSTADIYADRQLRLVIESDGASVGCIDLYDFDPYNKKSAVAIYIDKSYRRCGYGREALKLLTDYAFQDLDIRLLYAFIAQKNAASVSLFRSAGFAVVAILRAWLLGDDALIVEKKSNEG